MSSPPTSLRCSICHRTYSRLEHLERHLASHNESRPFRCTLCQSTFKRADVLKRHTRICEERRRGSKASSSAGEIVQQSKKRACEQCIRLKRACDLNLPCSWCSQRGGACIYSPSRRREDQVQYSRESRDPHVEGAVGSPKPLDLSFDTRSDGSATAAPARLGVLFHRGEPHSQGGSVWKAMDIQNLTAPDLDEEGQGLTSALSPSLLSNLSLKSPNLICSFDCGSLLQRERVIECVLQMNGTRSLVNNAYKTEHSPSKLFADRSQSPITSGLDHIWGYILPEGNQSREMVTENSRSHAIMPIFTSDWMFGSHLDYCTRYPFLSSGSAGPFQPNTNIQRTLYSDPLSSKTHEIVSLIKEAITFAPRSSMIEIRWSPAVEQECTNFFAPANILKFLELFWASWYPHWPAIHKPTFDLLSTKPTLLAAMILIGACVSPDTSHKESAKIWFDCVEEGAFGDDVLYRQAANDPRFPCSPISNSYIVQAVQALQAVYAVCILQNWEGAVQSKRRVQKFRYPVVVAVMKDLMKHFANYPDPLQASRSTFNWHDFIAHEQFKRTAIFVFLMDTALVIMHKLSPNMTIQDMEMSMACSDACFQAYTSSECYDHIPRWATLGISLAKAMDHLCCENMEPADIQSFAELGTLNLFLMTSAFHSQIYICKASIQRVWNCDFIRFGLYNWRKIWQLCLRQEAKSYRQYGHAFMDLHPRDMWKRRGFMQNAAEFCILAEMELEGVDIHSISPDESS